MPSLWFIDHDRRYATDADLAKLIAWFAARSDGEAIPCVGLSRDGAGEIVADREAEDGRRKVRVLSSMGSRDLVVLHVSNSLSWELTQQAKGKCGAIVVMSAGGWVQRPGSWHAPAQGDEPNGSEGVKFARLELLRSYGILFLEAWEKSGFSPDSVPWSVLDGASSLAQTLGAFDLLIQGAEKLTLGEDRIVEWIQGSFDQLRSLHPEITSPRGFVERCVPNEWDRSTKVLPKLFEGFDGSRESNTSEVYLASLKPTKALELLRAACRIARASEAVADAGTPAVGIAINDLDRHILSQSAFRVAFNHTYKELKKSLEC